MRGLKGWKVGEKWRRQHAALHAPGVVRCHWRCHHGPGEGMAMADVWLLGRHRCLLSTSRASALAEVGQN